MDFEFSPEELDFVADVRRFIAAQKGLPDAAEVMAPQREADSMLADSPARRAFNRRLAEAGYLGMSWGREYGGQEKSGVYDYLLNEELARVGAPLIGKGVGCIGKTLIAHGSEKLKREFLPKILRAEIEFALGYSEPAAGSDLASLQLRAVREGEDWVLNGQKMWTTSAHFADWYWVAARTDPEAPRHKGISVFLLPMDAPGLTVTEVRTMGDHRTNQVFFDNVRVPGDYLVGNANEGWTYVCEALDYDRFWVSEHHDSPVIAGSSPEVLLAAIGAATTTIRIGSGGVMLPHYSAYKVAENFAVLSNLYPGRVDLGVGRAPGADMNAAIALAADGRPKFERFPQLLHTLTEALWAVDALPQTTIRRGASTSTRSSRMRLTRSS